MKAVEPQARPWWKEAYVWMVIAGPLSAVVACAVTAVYIFQGPDRLVSDERFPQAQDMRQEIEQAGNPLQPAQVGRNHSATGGPKHAQP
jgi:hypothetical protein